MKLDYDLIRKILRDIEEKDQGNGYKGNLNIEGYTVDEVRYHCRMMEEDNLIKLSHYKPIGDQLGYFVQGMTMDGHRFLSLVDTDTFWGKIKKYIADNGISLTIESIKAVGSLLINQITYDKTERSAIFTFRNRRYVSKRC